MYHSKELVAELFYRSTVAKYRKRGYDEFEAQILALEMIQKSGSISCKEVL